MTKLLAKAFEEASRLPREKQDDLARHLMEDLADNNGSAETPLSEASRRRATKEDWRRKFEDLFSDLGGRQKPIGAEALQERIRQEADLGPDEQSLPNRERVAMSSLFAGRRTSRPVLSERR